MNLLEAIILQNDPLEELVDGSITKRNETKQKK